MKGYSYPGKSPLKQKEKKKSGWKPFSNEGEGSTIFGKSVDKIKHAISPTTGILSPKNIISTAKNLWKEHGPVINPSTKNPKGVGK